jgi:putative ABC transport system permease protein
MANLLADVRFALRLLRKSPAFAIGTAVVLALGIGSNAAVFSAIDQLVIRPLPYGDPDRLAMVWEDFSAFGAPKIRVSPGTFLDWRRRTRAFAALGAVRGAVINLAESGPPERVLGAGVTANLLAIVGVPPLLGRTLEGDEDEPGHHLVVISHRLWLRRFAGDPAIVGRSIAMSGEPYTIIGVMPRGFHFPDADTDFWMPLAIQPQQRTARNSHYLRVVGRLAAGATWSAARGDMTDIARQLAREFPATNDRVAITVTPLRDELTADAGRALTLLLGASACVLLIACANIANLLLARSARRRREVAVRMALGAPRLRVIGQLMTENFVLSALGGGIGIVIAYWSVRILARFVPPALSETIDLHLDWRAVAFAATTTSVAAVVFGMMPAIQLTFSGNAAASLRNDMFGGRDRRGMHARHAVAIAQIAIALVLVTGAALLADTLVHLRSLDPGFRSDRLLTADLTVPFPKYADTQRRIQFFSDVLGSVRAIPGVVRAGLTSDLPYTSRGNTMSVRIEGQEGLNGLASDALFRLVSPGYLETIGARLGDGRLLADADGENRSPVVVINEAFARQYWPNERALGHRIDTGTGNGPRLWMTVVGVVRDIKERGIDFADKPAVYVPFAQTTIAFFQPSEIAVRTSGPPLDLARALQRAVWAVDPEQPVSSVQTMEAIVDRELHDRQQMLTLLGAFASVALLLCAVGVYSVLSYLVSESRREIAIRIAIGATPARIVRSVVGRAAALAAVGVGLGAATSLATTRLLGSLLFTCVIRGVRL